MAKINGKKTDIIRTDPDFKKFVQDLSRQKSVQEGDNITPSRITQAMFKQYQKYPDLLSEIKGTKLGKWKGK